MREIIKSLEAIAHEARKSAEPAKTQEAIKAARLVIQNQKDGVSDQFKTLITELDQELSVWESKLPVIFKEQVGRQGIAKHTSYWVEQLKKCQTN